MRRFRTVSCGVALSSLLAAALLAAPVRAEEGGAAETPSNPFTYFAEAGFTTTNYFDDYAYSQHLSLGMSRPYRYDLRLSVSHDVRMGDDGIGVGLGYTRHGLEKFYVALGFATGTADVIHPEYMVGVTVGRPILPGDRVLAALSYLHTESKGAYYTETLGFGLTWYVDAHWIVGGFVRSDNTHPGDTYTWSGTFSLTYQVWGKTSVGAWIDYGDVSYEIMPSRFLMEYETWGYNMAFTQNLRNDTGVSLRLGYSELYEGGGATLSLFRTW